MTATETVSLLDYANARESVVLFWAGVGQPGGSYCRLGDPDDGTADAWLNCTGTVDADGDWRWDGECDIYDGRSNTVYKLHAYTDPTKWADLLDD